MTKYRLLLLIILNLIYGTLTQDYMCLELSKHYPSYSFDPIRAKLYDTYIRQS